MNGQTENMARAEAQARDYFRQGLNCAECVVQTFLDMHEVSLPPEIVGLATGFGGGIGMTKNTCGAINGAVLALGALKGRPHPFALETPAERTKEVRGLYAPFRAMVEEIEARYGTLICRELTAPLGDFAGKERRKGCQDIVGFCAALVTKYAEE